MAPLLEITGLTRRFGGVVAVNAIDLAVAEGELLGIIGPNGAGKSTLFNLVSGIDKPDAGRVRFAGEDVTGVAPERLAVRAVGNGRHLQVEGGLGRVGKRVVRLRTLLAGKMEQQSAWRGARVGSSRQAGV